MRSRSTSATLSLSISLNFFLLLSKGNEWNEEKKRGGKWFTGVCLSKMVIILKVFFSILFHGIKANKQEN